MLNKSSKIFIIMCSIVILLDGCKLSDKSFPSESELQNEIPIRVAKWYDDHKAAISLTFDEGKPYTDINIQVQNLVLDKNLPLDFEIVTYVVLNDSIRKDYILNKLLPNGFRVFGHGHDHYNHDKFSYEQSLESFKLCYDAMKQLGIKPVAYAYPGGFGYLFSTRRALKESGFLCGRRYEQLDVANPYIMPDSSYEPKDWFGLPSLVMQSFEYDGCAAAINNTEELIPFLEQSMDKTAWLILTYHSIGNKEEYGFYEMSDFKNDLDVIKASDFWCASMNDVTLYCYERNKAKVKASITKNELDIIESITIKLSDDLPNDYYDHPLTLKFQIPEFWINRKLVLEKENSKIGEFQFNSREAKISVLPDESTYILKLR